MGSFFSVPPPQKPYVYLDNFAPGIKTKDIATHGDLEELKTDLNGLVLPVDLLCKGRTCVPMNPRQQQQFLSLGKKYKTFFFDNTNPRPIHPQQTVMVSVDSLLLETGLFETDPIFIKGTSPEQFCKSKHPEPCVKEEISSKEDSSRDYLQCIQSWSSTHQWPKTLV